MRRDDGDPGDEDHQPIVTCGSELMQLAYRVYTTAPCNESVAIRRLVDRVKAEATAYTPWTGQRPMD